MLQDLFRKKEPYDYGKALQDLASICKNRTEYNVILPSVFYDANKSEYVVRFECAMREYYKQDRYFYGIRREEKIQGSNLEQLLTFAIAYAGGPDAFCTPPVDLPKGITMRVKNFTRTPNQYSISYKI